MLDGEETQDLRGAVAALASVLAFKWVWRESEGRNVHHLCDYSLKTLIATKYLATTDGFIPPLWPITLNLYSISQAHREKG